MNCIFSSSEIIGLFTRAEREYEVCATAEAGFDEKPAQLVVELDSFIRPVDIRRKEQHVPMDWLPGKQIVKESASHAEAPEMAREIFHRWVGKVRQSIPLPIHN